MYEVEELGRIEMKVIVVLLLKSDAFNQAEDEFLYWNA